MLVSIIGFLWSLLMLPVKLVLLPFRILSAIVSIVVYGAILLLIAGIIFFFVL